MVIYSRHNWFNDNIISYSSIVLIIILGNLLKFLIKINYWLSTSRYLRITSQIQKNLILIQKNQTLITILLVIIVPYWKTEIELGRDFLNFIYKKSSIVIKSYFDRRIRQLGSLCTSCSDRRTQFILLQHCKKLLSNRPTSNLF